MKYIIRNTETLEYNELKSYPAKDESKPLHGLDEDLEIFKIVDELPEYDKDRQRISKDGYIFTDELYNSHLKIANINYLIAEISQDEIVGKLTTSLGTHLDEQYPMWERIKHSGEGNYIVETQITKELTQAQIDRRTYIDSVYKWTVKCRDDRDLREKELIDNNTFPSFEWDDRPTN